MEMALNGENLMPYQHREPVSEREMDKTRWDGHHSICQTLRDIYHMTDDCEVKLKCRLAMAMAKAMHEKLKEYKQTEAVEQLKQEYIDATS